VGKRRRAAFDPPHEVVPVAPAQPPVAAFKDTVLVAGLEGAPDRRRDGPGGMAQFVLELAAARDPDDRRIAGIALYRRGRHRAAALELARRRPSFAGTGLNAGADDQLPPAAR